MTGNGVPPVTPDPPTPSSATAPPAAVRRVETAHATALAELAATFEDLQTVLRCCERLMSELATPIGGPDDVVVESLWTVALLSYARSFSGGRTGTLTEDDVVATLPKDEALKWHKVLLQLRDHYADPVVNPREQFSVGVAQDEQGAPSGVAITSSSRPPVDDVTIRQTGAIAFALSSLVNDRIGAQQEKVFDELRGTSRADLEKLTVVDVVRPEGAR